MNTAPTILFAEDTEDDRILFSIGFEREKFPFSLQFVSDGIEAVQYLTGEGKFADRRKYPIPNLLLTDLMMPRMNGFELISWARAQRTWKNLPVVVISGSDQVEDRQRALNLGANAYVMKDLLMQPTAALHDAILQLTIPAKVDLRRLTASRHGKNY